MILVDLTEKKAIEGPYSAMTSNTRHNLHLAHTQDPSSEPSFYSTTPLNPFSVPQYLSMWKDVPIPDSPTTTQENDNHPGSIEQGLEQMAATLEEGIDAMQSNKASTQGEPHDPTDTTILIQAAQSQLAALASRLHSPANHMERNLRFNAITNCFGRIHDSITKLESIPLASTEYETTPPSAPSISPREKLDQFLMSTTHRAKHWSFCVWDECDVHMDGTDRHYYPSGP